MEKLLSTCPFVSIAIISYNQRDYLEKCLKSALSQTYPNLEIVVSDDASSDGSWELIQEYVALSPGIIRGIRNEKNLGLIGNREVNLANTRGEFIAWLDADDLAYPQRIERQVDYLLRNPAYSACYFNMDIYRGSERTDQTVYGTGRSALEGDQKTLIREENFVMSSAIMYDASAIGRRGYRSIRGATFSDWQFFVNLGKAGKIGFIDDVLGAYRRHSSAATASSKNIKSGVRQRRELALNAMLEQIPEEKELICYALARFYLSQLSGAAKQSNVSATLSYAAKLGKLHRHALAAVRDRYFTKKNLLPSFE